jgi:lysophospholipase L1-like esterase
MIPEQFFSNYISASYDNKGYVKFLRFYPEQMETYSKDRMFKEMSESAAGVILSFITTGNSVEFRCKTESKLKIFLPVMQQITINSVLYAIKNLPKANKKKGRILLDGIDFVVDGKLLSTKRTRRGKIKFHFDNPLKKKCEVKIYFPTIFEMHIKNLKINGTVEKPAQKEKILCLGDSITQGFISGYPSCNYVARIAALLNVDAINQGVGGYIYNSASLNGLQRFKPQFGLPKFITVAYGTNDWHRKIPKDILQNNIREYYKRLIEIFPDTPIYVITPIWRGDIELETNDKAYFYEIQNIIQKETSLYKTIKLINGLRLIPHEFKFFSDVYLHPNAEGFNIMAHCVGAYPYGSDNGGGF